MSEDRTITREQLDALLRELGLEPRDVIRLVFATIWKPKGEALDYVPEIEAQIVRRDSTGQAVASQPEIVRIAVEDLVDAEIVEGDES